MKKEGRTVLACRKTLRCGVEDMFHVTVASNDKDGFKKYYEGMGYKVSVK